MADVASITLVQRFTYRGAPEEWSNRYHFGGTVPADATGWHDLAVALFTIVKGCILNSHSLVRAYGYLADGADSVATVDFTAPPLSPIPGALSQSGGACPGDAAFTVRWLTDKRTSKGKPIYLRKYFHGPESNLSNVDQLFAAQLTAAQTMAASLESAWGSTDAKLCDKYGDPVTAASASQWITTRTLKRRGRRPPS